MRYLLAIRRRWPVFALVALYAYLTLHTLSGSQGIMQWSDYENDAIDLARDLAGLQVEREALELEASALSSRSLDLDALDVAARRVLYVSQPGELVIPVRDPVR